MGTRPSKRRLGQSLVEVALILPMVVIVITGLGEFTWIFWNFIAIGNAAHEGARDGAVGNDWNAMDQTVKGSMIGLAVTTVTIEVFDAQGILYDRWSNGTSQNSLPFPPPGDLGVGRRYTVKVTARAPYDYLTILPNMVPGMAQLREVRGTSTALIETSRQAVPF